MSIFAYILMGIAGLLSIVWLVSAVIVAVGIWRFLKWFTKHVGG